MPQRDLWPVKADIAQFEQVIVNLAVNARDAMPDGGKLTLRTANVGADESARFHYKGMPIGEYVLVEVEDTGTGIPPEIIDKIFDPFFTTKEVGKGTGLGLSTVYGIIKQTGGFVYVESEVGKGTTFRIFIPRYIPPPTTCSRRYCRRPRRARHRRRDLGRRRHDARRRRRSHRAGHHPAGRGRGGPARAQCARPHVARLYRDRGRQRRRGDRGRWSGRAATSISSSPTW